jgi:hypothetical protein
MNEYKTTTGIMDVSSGRADDPADPDCTCIECNESLAVLILEAEERGRGMERARCLAVVTKWSGGVGQPTLGSIRQDLLYGEGAHADIEAGEYRKEGDHG